MIEQSKQRNALAALNSILVWARHLAREGRSDDLVELLDVAEYLPMLMLEAKEKTAEFRLNLVELERKYPGVNGAVERFDAPKYPLWNGPLS